MSTQTNYRKILVEYWRQYYPEWDIPKGYHVHHIKPKCTFEDPDDPQMHHPSNLIALHPDDHLSIHRCRGDKFVDENFILNIVGKKASIETKKKISQSNTGQKRTAETKKNISNALKGRKLSADHIESLRNAKLGTKLSESHKQSMSKAQKGRIMSQEHKDNLKEAWKTRKVGRKHYNNGTVSIMCFEDEVPPGFVPGRIKWK